jgi:hypothetical protein
MFEYAIQKAWEEQRSDMGAGRLGIFICFYNAFLLFFSVVFLGVIPLLALYPIGLALIFFFLRPKISRASSLTKFLINCFSLTMTAILNYYLVGEIDRAAGGLPRLDAHFAAFDQALFGQAAANSFGNVLDFFGSFKSLVYDSMMVSYLLYFLLPFYGAIAYYRRVPEEKRYMLGRYFSSVIMYYSLNYLFYLFVPVTGPQFFLVDQFVVGLPLSGFGQWLHAIVQSGQTTFIDCFPSGHSGISLLVTIWFFRFYHPKRYWVALVTFLIMLATLSLRYHYVMDLLAAFPMAIIAYKLGWLMYPVEVSKSHRGRIT